LPSTRNGKLTVDVLDPDVPVWEAEVYAEVLDPAGKSLVQPQMGPPLHRYQVTEPLMRQLVTWKQ